MPPQPPEAPVPVRPAGMAQVVTFAVVEGPHGFIPVRITLDDGKEIDRVQLHEPTPFRALAYEYLQGDVALYYGYLVGG
jgi:hypothetical protein